MVENIGPKMSADKNAFALLVIIIILNPQMSIDKTLRLTEQSGSEITSFLDPKARISIGQTYDQFLGLPRLNCSHSLKNLRIQTSRYSNIQYQNEMLRNEIISLKKQLKYQREMRENKEEELKNQIFKLKNLIQKSYYSLKGIEHENISIKKQATIEKEINEKQRQRIQYLEQKSNEMYSYIQNIKGNHETEINLIWERVAHLQRNLESVVKLIQEERKQEKIYTHSRTSSYESSGGEKKKIILILYYNVI